MRNNFNILFYNEARTMDEFTLAANSSRDVDIDCANIESLKLVTEVLFTSTPSSITLTTYLGAGGNDNSATGNVPCKLDGTSVAYYGDNGTAVTLSNSQTVTGEADTYRTSFAMNDLVRTVPRWVKLRFANTNLSTDATIKIYTDT